MSVSGLPMFSFRNLMISSLTFRLLIHFRFIFMYDMRKQSNLIFLHVAVQFSQSYLLKQLSFFHCISLPPLSQINFLQKCAFIYVLCVCVFNCQVMSYSLLPCGLQHASLPCLSLSPRVCSNSWAVYSVLLIYVSVFLPVPYCFDYCSFVVQFEIRAYDASSFVLSQDCLDYSESFVFQYTSQNCLFQFVPIKR